jgi:lycopene cyclase domain-containing protein
VVSGDEIPSRAAPATLPVPWGVDTVGPRYRDAPVDLDRFQYLALMGACLVLTLPLEVVIGARVWRQFRRLLAALWFPVAAFTLWDEIAIARGHWTYNPRFITGLKLPVDLPIEELVFFVVIPICGLLTYEAVRRVLRRP